jgi:hypothetical protein
MSPSETDGKVTAGHVVVDRPPPGLARGKYPLPAWTIAGIGATVVLGGLVYVFRRFYGRAKK